MHTEYLATTEDGAVYCPLFGYRVEQRGRFGKWNKRGLYCSEDAARFAIDRIYGTNPYTGSHVECRIIKESV